MTDRSYTLFGAGFTLQGTIDEERLHLMVRLLDKVATELAQAALEDRAAKWEKKHEVEPARSRHGDPRADGESGVGV